MRTPEWSPGDGFSVSAPPSSSAAKRQRRSAGVLQEMRLIDPYAYVREVRVALVTRVPAQSGCWKFCGSVPLVEGILYFDISPNVPCDISSNITN
jgi:hypothetical protein